MYRGITPAHNHHSWLQYLPAFRVEMTRSSYGQGTRLNCNVGYSNHEFWAEAGGVDKD